MRFAQSSGKIFVQLSPGFPLDKILRTWYNGNFVARRPIARRQNKRTVVLPPLPCRCQAFSHCFIVVGFACVLVLVIIIPEDGALTSGAHSADYLFPLCCSEIGEGFLNEFSAFISAVILFLNLNRVYLSAKSAVHHEFYHINYLSFSFS